MLRDGLPIGRVFGIPLRLHYSWFFIFVLITWALATSYFPSNYPNWTLATSVAAALVTSILFFASVVAHELMHSRVAQAEGITVQSITLFIFGGLAQMSEEPRRPRDEFLIAIAGPLASLALGGIFRGIWFWSGDTNEFIHAITDWLSWINIYLGLFNLIPGFPLDGGRVLRSLLWWRNANLKKSTRIASTIGRGVGFIFIFAGIWWIFNGNWANGLWIALIGWFLENAAVSSYRQLALQEMLQSHNAGEIMTRDYTLVAPDITVERLVNEYFLASGRRCFPVVENDRILGLVTLHNVKAVPRERWHSTSVRQAMTTWENIRTVSPNESLVTVLKIMAEDDINQIPVVQDHNIMGMIGRDNLISFINVRGELEP